MRKPSSSVFIVRDRLPTLRAHLLALYGAEMRRQRQIRVHRMDA